MNAVIHWAWSIVAFFVGMFIGIFVPAWLRWSEGYSEDDRW